MVDGCSPDFTVFESTRVTALDMHGKGEQADIDLITKITEMSLLYKNIKFI
jgi:hypothetical protein